MNPREAMRFSVLAGLFMSEFFALNFCLYPFA